MNTAAKPPAARPTGHRKGISPRLALGLLLGVVALTACGMAAWLWLRPTAASSARDVPGPGGGDTPEFRRAAELAAKAVSGQADAPARLTVQEALAALSAEDRNTLADTLRRRMLQDTARRMERFFELPPADQQKMLDGTLDTIQRYRWVTDLAMNNELVRSQLPMRMAAMNTNEQLRHLRNLAEASSPSDRARMSEYYRRLQERAQQRNIQVPGPYP